MAKLRLKHVEHLEGDVFALRETLSRINDTLAEHGVTLARLSGQMALWPALDVDRVETLLSGVKLALERMGGNTLPSMMADVHALRDQMSEFRREMSGYRSMLMVLSNWLDTVTTKPEPPEEVARKEWFKPKRPYNRRKKPKPEVENSDLDAAPHNDQPEVEP